MPPPTHNPAETLLGARRPIDVAALEASLAALPARWAVALLEDAAGAPLQLLVSRNLRALLRRRLADAEPGAPSRRIDYRAVVAAARFARVDSAFEADWVYHECAPRLLPQAYERFGALPPAWFLHIDPDAEFPQYVRTSDLSIASGELLGPVKDRGAAARLIEQINDWFDLCRYHHILTQAPNATACPYKDMGKCPAPCDGSVSMQQYRRLVALSLSTVIDPADHVREHTRRMQAASAELRFEIAARIREYVESLSTLRQGPWRHVRRLRDFNYVAVQPGGGAGRARLFAITAGSIRPLASTVGEVRAGELLRAVLEATMHAEPGPLDEAGRRRVALVAHHLFHPGRSPGRVLPVDALDEATLAAACREAAAPKRAPDAAEADDVAQRELSGG